MICSCRSIGSTLLPASLELPCEPTKYKDLKGIEQAYLNSTVRQQYANTTISCNKLFLSNISRQVFSRHCYLSFSSTSSRRLVVEFTILHRKEFYCGSYYYGNANNHQLVIHRFALPNIPCTLPDSTKFWGTLQAGRLTEDLLLETWMLVPKQ